MRKRRYDGASYSGLTSDWITSLTSADTELVTSLRRLRSRSRDLFRNDDYLTGALTFIVDNIVGSGSTFQSQVRLSDNKEESQIINETIELAWQEWTKAKSCHTAGKLNLGDIERLILMELVEAGEVFVRLVKQRFGDSEVPLSLELIEADQLYDNDFSGSYNGNQIRMGVELNEWMRPVAYHFYEHHPGDYQFTGGSRGGQTYRINASEIYHLFISKRVGQTRGIPFLHASLLRTRHLNKYEEAELVKARVQALISGFIQSPEPDVLGTEDEETGRRFQRWEPGDILPLAPGEEFVGFDPTSPNQNYDPFIRVQNRGISAGIGLSYESYSNDFTNTSYSSARTSRLKEQDRFRNLQSFLLNHFHRPLYHEWLSLAVLSKVVDLPNYYLDPELYCCPKFFFRGWQSVDPYKETRANLLDVEAGFNTITGVLAQKGKDLEELVRERRRELDLFEEYGITTTTTRQSKRSEQNSKPSAKIILSEPELRRKIQQRKVNNINKNT